MIISMIIHELDMPRVGAYISSKITSKITQGNCKIGAYISNGCSLLKRSSSSSTLASNSSRFNGSLWLGENDVDGGASQELEQEIKRYSVKKRTAVSLKHMMDFGQFPMPRNVMLSARFLHEELPVRFAHRVAELHNLPYGLSSNTHILKVRDWYIKSFKDIRNFPPIRDRVDELKFAEFLQWIKTRHNDVVPTIAMGIREFKKELGLQQASVLNEVNPEIHQFLDRFFMSRIGIRMLIGQYVALHHPKQRSTDVGLISLRERPLITAQSAIDDARAMCMRTYGNAPEVHAYGDPNLTFPYVTQHLHHMVFEVVKNSLRAVAERFMNADGDPPPIKVVVADGAEDVTIKISDEGGGIPRSGLPKIWSYLYSTSKCPSKSTFSQDLPPNMAGYGFGLPLTRLHARYFGGDMQIISMEGYGTDAYLHLTRLCNVLEPLP